ncbi:hypothetical protein [Staphylococcus aureus]
MPTTFGGEPDKLSFLK